MQLLRGNVIGMMVAELTYEETFTLDNVILQLVFLKFVFLWTLLLNNLLIGLTMSNVREEPQKENNMFMLKDIIYYCEDAREPNILQRK